MVIFIAWTAFLPSKQKQKAYENKDFYVVVMPSKVNKILKFN